MCRVGRTAPWPSNLGEAGRVSRLQSLGQMAAGQHPSFYASRTKDTPRLSLLLVILGVIFMNGNCASEGEWLDPRLGGGVGGTHSVTLVC